MAKRDEAYRRYPPFVKIVRIGLLATPPTVDQTESGISETEPMVTQSESADLQTEPVEVMVAPVPMETGIEPPLSYSRSPQIEPAHVAPVPRPRISYPPVYNPSVSRAQRTVQAPARNKMPPKEPTRPDPVQTRVHEPDFVVEAQPNVPGESYRYNQDETYPLMQMLQNGEALLSFLGPAYIALIAGHLNAYLDHRITEAEVQIQAQRVLTAALSHNDIVEAYFVEAVDISSQWNLRLPSIQPFEATGQPIPVPAPLPPRNAPARVVNTTIGRDGTYTISSEWVRPAQGPTLIGLRAAVFPAYLQVALATTYPLQTLQAMATINVSPDDPAVNPYLDALPRAMLQGRSRPTVTFPYHRLPYLRFDPDIPTWAAQEQLMLALAELEARFPEYNENEMSECMFNAVDNDTQEAWRWICGSVQTAKTVMTLFIVFCRVVRRTQQVIAWNNHGQAFPNHMPDSEPEPLDALERHLTNRLTETSTAEAYIPANPGYVDEFESPGRLPLLKFTDDTNIAMPAVASIRSKPLTWALTLLKEIEDLGN